MVVEKSQYRGKEFQSNPLVPKLDFTKIFELRDKTNLEEKVNKNIEEIKQEYDEDIPLSMRDDFVGQSCDIAGYESPTNIHTQYAKFYPSGSTINSCNTLSVIRKEELAQRKAAVINELNSTYTDDQREGTSNNESSNEQYEDLEDGDDTGNVPQVML